MIKALYTLHEKQFDTTEQQANSASKIERKKYLNSKIKYPDTMNMGRNRTPLDFKDIKSKSRKRHNSQNDEFISQRENSYSPSPKQRQKKYKLDKSPPNFHLSIPTYRSQSMNKTMQSFSKRDYLGPEKLQLKQLFRKLDIEELKIEQKFLKFNRNSANNSNDNSNVLK